MVFQRYLTTREAADILRISTPTLLRWLKRGHIKGVRPNLIQTGWRIPESEVRRLMLLDVEELVDKLAQV